MVLPLDLLEQALNARIGILLKDGRTMEGKLVGYDQYMNVVLEEADEKSTDQSRKLGTVVVRGNNIISLTKP